MVNPTGLLQTAGLSRAGLRGQVLLLGLLLALPTALLGCSGSPETSEPRDTVSKDLEREDTPWFDLSTRDLEPEIGRDAESPALPLTPFPWAGENMDQVCNDNLDNDGNGYRDCDDFACSRNIAVTVCGSHAAYEGSPEACSNNRDDDGDGLVDCLDPDCSKNPFHQTCPRLPREEACTPGVDGDGDGLAGCEDPDCWPVGACNQEAKTRVLFDQTLDETAAAGPNSDWVIDAAGPAPWPSNPTSASEWHGALSSFAFDLYSSGSYMVESLVSWEGRLSNLDQTNPQDLANYQVLVIFEPSRGMTDQEKSAVIDFVLQGGGVLMVANHLGADRDGNGWSAPMVLNDLLDNNPTGANPFGFRFDEVDIDTGAALTNLRNPEHPVLDGPFGKVVKIGFYDGCSLQIEDQSKVTPLILLPGARDDQHDIAVAAVEAGEGRLVLLTDSAIGGDGSDSHGNNNPGHNSWSETNKQNNILLLNAVAWLAR